MAIVGAGSLSASISTVGMTGSGTLTPRISYVAFFSLSRMFQQAGALGLGGSSFLSINGSTLKARVPVVSDDKRDKIQALFAGLLMPNLPAFNPKWNLVEYHKEMEAFLRKLMDYIRRLLSKFTEQSFAGEDMQAVVGWRYDRPSKTFQTRLQKFKVLSKSDPSDWMTIAEGSQAMRIGTLVNGVFYSTSTHQITKDQTTAVYVLDFDTTFAGLLVDQAGNCST